MKIAIIGRGFSGICAAYQLVKYHSEHQMAYPIEIIFIDSQNFGGNTYNRPDVAVGMANPVRDLGIPYQEHAADSIKSQPTFFAQHIPPSVIADDKKLREEHISHNAYGDYLRGFLWELIEKITRTEKVIQITNLDQKAVDITRSPKLTVTLQDGSEIDVDKIVLATGNVEPQSFKKIEQGTFYYNNDDLASNKDHAAETNDMVILGMGNGAHYTALNSFDNGFTGVITLVSKNGYKPSYRGQYGMKSYVPKIMTHESITKIINDVKKESLLDHFKRLFEQELMLAKSNGYCFYDVIDSIHEHVIELWVKLDTRTKQLISETLLVHFNNIRYRIPDRHADRIEALIRSGNLKYQKGLQDMRLLPDGRFQFDFDDGKQLLSSKVINNTGPSPRIEYMGELMKNLARKGIIQQSPLGGIKASITMQVESSDGTENNIYAIGPILCGTHLTFTVREIMKSAELYFPAEDILRPRPPRVQAHL